MVLANLPLRFKFKGICVLHKKAANSFNRILGLAFNTLTGSPYLVVELLMAKVIATNIKVANPTEYL